MRNLDISFIEQSLDLKNDELVVLGGRPGMGKTLFVLSLLNNSSKKACYISLCESSEEIAFKEDKMNISPDNKKYKSTFLDRPSLIELLELIVSQKENFDYFVIDDMSGLSENVNPLFCKDKNYQFVLRYLKLVAKSLVKNIILVSPLHKRIVKELSFNYYSFRENFIDHIIIIDRPAYHNRKYKLYESFYELYEPFEDDDAFLHISKTKLLKKRNEFKLKYKYPFWSFPKKKVDKWDVPFNDIAPF